MQENRVKRILREGGMALGTYGGSFAGTTMIELIGHAGFDAVFIDMEHQPLDFREIQMQIIAAERVGISAIVRTPGFDPALILRLLDMGVPGVQVPHCDGIAAAKAAVEAVRYSPMGDRGIAGATRASNYGKIPFLQHAEESNREILLSVMVEDLRALDEIDEIAALPGVDLIALGPSDMSQALGVAGQVDHPKLWAAIGRVAEACRKPGRARLSLSTGHAVFPRTTRELKEMGVGYSNATPAPEVRLLRSMSEQVAQIRKDLEA